MELGREEALSCSGRFAPLQWARGAVMGCTWAVPGMKAGACTAGAGCDRLHRFLWMLHPSCRGGLDFGGEYVSRWSCLLMFPSDLQCRRVLRSCVEAAGVYGLWEGSLSHPSFTVPHGPVVCMGQKLRLPARLPRKTDCSPLLGRLGQEQDLPPGDT